MPKNWCFWIMVWEKTLESPLDCKDIKLVNPKGNQLWIVIGKTAAEAEVLILWPPYAKPDSLEKILMLGKTEGRRRRGQQRMTWLDGITSYSMDMSLSKPWEIEKDREAWHAEENGFTKSWTWLSVWTTTKCHYFNIYCCFECLKAFMILNPIMLSSKHPLLKDAAKDT